MTSAETVVIPVRKQQKQQEENSIRSHIHKLCNL